MCSFRDRLRHQQMIEWVTMVKRKLSKCNQTRVGNIEPIEPLIRQDCKDLVYICIKLANPQFYGDFPKGNDAYEHIIFGLAYQAAHMTAQPVIVI